MVRVSITDLNENHVRHRRYFQQVIRPPLNGLNGIAQLRPHSPPEVYNTPRQHCRRKSHREPELYVVSGVVISSSQINLYKNKIFDNAVKF